MATVDDSARSTPPAGILVEGYPGAAFEVDAGGKVVAANRRGESLAALHGRGLLPEVADLLDRAAGGSVAAGTVFLPGLPGNAVVEVTVVPRVAGGALVLARDLTMERNLRSALVESRTRYKDLVEISSDFAWEVGPDGRLVFVTPRGALGYAAQDLVGLRPDELVVEPTGDDPSPFVTDRPREDAEMWLARADGELACVLVSSLPITDEDGSWRGARGICRDITEEREREIALGRARYREQVLNTVARAIRDEIDPHNMLAAAAGAVVRALGVSGCGVFRRRDDGTLALAAQAGGELPESALLACLGDIDPGGREVEASWETWSILAATTLHHHEMNGVLCVWKPAGKGEWDDDDRILVNDIANQLGVANEQYVNHERILRLSRTDGLTGLLNRRAFFEEELPRRLKRLQHGQGGATLMFIDMDNFKLVNDAHGHQKGDEAILRLRDILRDNSRPGDLIARLGGDEFAVWMDGIPEDVVLRRAEALIKASGALRDYSGSRDQPLGISVGIAMYSPAGGECLDNLLTRADWAMYQVKRAGKGGFRIAPAPGLVTLRESGEIVEGPI